MRTDLPRVGIIGESACSLKCRTRHFKESISIAVMNSVGKVVMECTCYLDEFRRRTQLLRSTGRGRRRLSTVNCCRSTKFSKMRSRRLRKSRRRDPNGSQSTLSIVRFIQECWPRSAAMLLIFGAGQSFGEAQDCGVFEYL